MMNSPTSTRAYLSSYRLGDEASTYLNPQKTGKAAIVMNALDVYGESRLRDFQREVDDLASLGFESEELDLRRFAGSPDRLMATLRQVDMLWVVGGNSFTLARAMTRAGLAGILPQLQQEGLVYAGYSAGSCVATPDLRGIEEMDPPDVAFEGEDLSTPADTLGLIPFRIVPHWKSDHPESSLADAAAANMQRLGLPFQTLRDGEAIVIFADGTIL